MYISDSGGSHLINGQGTIYVVTVLASMSLKFASLWFENCDQYSLIMHTLTLVVVLIGNIEFAEPTE